MSKIVYVTNVMRRLGVMQQQRDALLREGKLQGEMLCRWVDDSTVWNDQWEQALQHADFVLGKWMNASMDSPFWRRLQQFLQRHGVPYYIGRSATWRGTGSAGAD